MCPSYMVTREEKHSTRGRARLLLEMLHGDELPSGWRDETCAKALDLCLACKGCKSECPVNVDMATLQGRVPLAPLRAAGCGRGSAYAFGLIDRWARARVALRPGSPTSSRRRPCSPRSRRRRPASRPQRRLPPFSRTTLQAWAHDRRPPRDGRARGASSSGRTRSPTTSPRRWVLAAVEVLEAAGFRVLVPRQRVCCGRPLYDYGFLDLARRYLERTLRILRSAIRAGVPVVGVEPSCVAVFRDELTKMLPHDEDAQRLSTQTFHLAEFLDAQDGYEPPRLEREVLVHGHCHAAATGGVEPAHRLLERMGTTSSIPDAGCCGMAGAWGYEQAHYDVSHACGERVLLPAVRAAPRRSSSSPTGSRAGTRSSRADRPTRTAHRSGPAARPPARGVRPCRRVPGALRPSASGAVPPAGQRRAGDERLSVRGGKPVDERLRPRS